MHRHAPLAVSQATATRVAVAPCYFQVQLPAAAGDLVEIQATPAGTFRPRDGRRLPVEAWRMDAEIAARVIERFRALLTPLVVDYEHQTLHAEDNGQPAPAAGFIRDMEWREGSGLWLKVELTPRARQYIAAGEYRYFSPVFRFDRTGAVVELLMGALTNNPALDGMAPLELRAAARFTVHEDPVMKNKLLLAVCTALGIAHENRDEAQVEAEALRALAAFERTPDPLAPLRQQLQLADDVDADGIVAACRKLQEQVAGGAPDPAKFVSVEVVRELRDQVAALTAHQAEREIDELIEPALEDGRLLPAQEQWARELGRKDIASLRAYLKDVQPIAALRRSQTHGQPPGETTEYGLTPEELAVCRATGVAPAAFAKCKSQSQSQSQSA